MILRMVVVLAAVAVFALAVAVLERRRGPRRLRLPTGVVVVTGPGCALCGPTVAALEARGISPATLDIADLPSTVGVIRSLPVVYVVGEAGDVLLRRSGRSALTDVPTIARAAVLV